MNIKDKYFKYKEKYLNLYRQIHGGVTLDSTQDIVYISSNYEFFIVDYYKNSRNTDYQYAKNTLKINYNYIVDKDFNLSRMIISGNSSIDFSSRGRYDYIYDIPLDFFRNNYSRGDSSRDDSSRDDSSRDDSSIGFCIIFAGTFIYYVTAAYLIKDEMEILNDYNHLMLSEYVFDPTSYRGSLLPPIRYNSLDKYLSSNYSFNIVRLNNNNTYKITYTDSENIRHNYYVSGGYLTFKTDEDIHKDICDNKLSYDQSNPTQVSIKRYGNTTTVEILKQPTQICLKCGSKKAYIKVSNEKNKCDICESTPEEIPGEIYVSFCGHMYCDTCYSKYKSVESKDIPKASVNNSDLSNFENINGDNACENQYEEKTDCVDCNMEKQFILNFGFKHICKQCNKEKIGAMIGCCKHLICLKCYLEKNKKMLSFIPVAQQINVG